MPCRHLRPSYILIHSHLADYILKNTEAHGLFCAQTSIRLSNNYDVLQLTCIYIKY